MITLQSLGWNSFFNNKFRKYENAGFIPGRISVEHKERYMVLTEYGEVKAEVSGKLIYSADNPSDFPKTGDWIAGTYFQDEQKVIIHDVLERKTKFSRNAAGKKNEEQIIAANIDYLFIMQSMDNDFSLRRLERYLSTAIEGKIKPVIILSKMDLCNDPENKLKDVQDISGNTPVLATSSVSGYGINNVMSYVSSGITIAFVGSSGVGKSTLINLLAGKEIQGTQEVREADSKGRHTTTRRELFLLSEDGLLIDTPGMREFQLWDADEGLQQVFDEIEELAFKCRFSNCTHTKETGCAVLSSRSFGELSEERYQSYLKLRKEIKYLESKEDKNSALEEKRKWKVINKEQKRYLKNNPKM